VSDVASAIGGLSGLVGPARSGARGTLVQGLTGVLKPPTAPMPPDTSIAVDTSGRATTRGFNGTPMSTVIAGRDPGLAVVVNMRGGARITSGRDRSDYRAAACGDREHNPLQLRRHGHRSDRFIRYMSERGAAVPAGIGHPVPSGGTLVHDAAEQHDA
jgi:hypothetical protein